MKLLPLIGFLAISAAVLTAQDESAPDTTALPSGPLIQTRAPEDSRWTITVYLTSSKPPPAPSTMSPSVSPSPITPAGPTPINPASLHSIFSITTITKTGKLIHVAWTDANREVWNIWVEAGQQVCVWPGGKRMGTPAPVPVAFGSKLRSGNPVLQDFSTSDFHGFEWISPSNFTGVGLVGGKKCLIFKNDTSIAATDFETRLPVQLQADGELTLYRFQNISDTMQSPPEEVQKYFKSLPHATAATVPTPAPY